MSAPSSPPAGPRAIKRYANRKLYDPAARRYVTLDDVARLVAQGDDVEVLDQATGEDLTTLVLAQVLLDGVRQRTTRLPRQVLARLIRIAGTTAEVWEHWPEPREAAGRAGHEAERIAGRFLAGGRPTLEDAMALREEIGQLVHRLVEEAQSGVEARFRSLLSLGEGAAGKSLDVLRTGLHVLDGRSSDSSRKKEPAPKRARRVNRAKK